MFAHKA